MLDSCSVSCFPLSSDQSASGTPTFQMRSPSPTSLACRLLTLRLSLSLGQGLVHSSTPGSCESQADSLTFLDASLPSASKNCPRSRKNLEEMACCSRSDLGSLVNSWVPGLSDTLCRALSVCASQALITAEPASSLSVMWPRRQLWR